MTGDRARVTLLPDPEAGVVSVDGPVRSVQEAELRLPTAAYGELWRSENLERLARAYWAYLSRASLGLFKVRYAPDARTIVLAGRGLPLLRFRRPEYVTGPGLGQVTWRIERGLLVARPGRGRGYLRIAVRGTPPMAGEREALVRVRAEVANFYPLLRGGGRFARVGARLYGATQLRIHVWITRGFLRSLARLDLPASPVGALAPPGGRAASG